MPPTPVSGIYLTGVLFQKDGTPMVDALVRIERVNFSTRTNEEGEFKIPVEKMTSKIVSLEISHRERVIRADIPLPPDVLKSVNQAHVDLGQEPLEGAEPTTRSQPLPDGTQPIAKIERRLGLQIPENVSVAASVGGQVEKQSLLVSSLPALDTGESTKQVSFWTQIENESNADSVRFSWTLDAAKEGLVRVVFAWSELELSQWDGAAGTIPMWSGRGSGGLGNFSPLRS